MKATIAIVLLFRDLGVTSLFSQIRSDGSLARFRAVIGWSYNENFSLFSRVICYPISCRKVQKKPLGLTLFSKFLFFSSVSSFSNLTAVLNLFAFRASARLCKSSSNLASPKVKVRSAISLDSCESPYFFSCY